MNLALSESDLLGRLRGRVSSSQLKRWRQQGLFPAWTWKLVYDEPGRGKAMRWHDSVVERAQLIDKTMKSGDPTYRRAGRALFTAGYEIRAAWMREFLMEIPDEVTQALGKWRNKTSLKQPKKAHVKRKNLAELVQRELGALNEEVVELYVSILAGIADIAVADDTSPGARIGHMLSPRALATVIEECSDDELVTLYKQCSEFDQIAVVYSWVLMTLQPFQYAKELKYLVPLTGHPTTAVTPTYENCRLALLWRVIFAKRGLGIADDLTAMVRGTIDEALKLHAAAPALADEEVLVR